MLNHPEKKDSEDFVGNTHKGESRIEFLKRMGISTARLGNQAYDIDGKRLPPEIYRPVMIDKKDSRRYDDMMMSLTFGDGFRSKV